MICGLALGPWRLEYPGRSLASVTHYIAQIIHVRPLLSIIHRPPKKKKNMDPTGISYRQESKAKITSRRMDLLLQSATTRAVAPSVQIATYYSSLAVYRIPCSYDYCCCCVTTYIGIRGAGTNQVLVPCPRTRLAMETPPIQREPPIPPPTPSTPTNAMDVNTVMSPANVVESSSGNGSGDLEKSNGFSLCEECEDRRSVWDCQQGCGGAFCDVCFYALHRKGKRALHKPEKIARPGAASLNGGSAGGVDGARGEGGGGLLSGLIGPRLPPKEEVNPDMYDR